MWRFIKRLFGACCPKVIPSKYENLVDACIASVERKVGYQGRKLRKVYFIERAKAVYSKSLGRHVAILDTGNVGDWSPVSIRIAVLPNGEVANEVVEHEIAHQIAHESGLTKELHCYEFRNKVWNWQ